MSARFGHHTLSSDQDAGDVASGDAEPNESSMSSDTTRKPPTPPPKPVRRRWQNKEPGTTLTNEDCEAIKGAVIQKDREQTSNFNDSMQTINKATRSRKEYKRLVMFWANHCGLPRAKKK